MIQKSKAADAENIASLVSGANKDVADMFGITFENAPKHPSFYTAEKVLSDFSRGEEYFLFHEDGKSKGCVAFEQPNESTSYLNRLSVLPQYRHRGVGASLVHFILDYSSIKRVKNVSIGIIAEHEVLKKWYLDLGFVAGDVKQFDHLPFTVLFMHFNLT